MMSDDGPLALEGSTNTDQLRDAPHRPPRRLARGRRDPDRAVPDGLLSGMRFGRLVVLRDARPERKPDAVAFVTRLRVEVQVEGDRAAGRVTRARRSRVGDRSGRDARHAVRARINPALKGRPRTPTRSTAIALGGRSRDGSSIRSREVPNVELGRLVL